MSLPSAVIDAMVAAGCTAEQLAAAVKAASADDEARAARKREIDAARKRRQRANVTLGHAESRGHGVTDADSADMVSPKEKSPLHPPKEITPSQSVPEANASSTDNARSRFAVFWSLYPHKVGKAAAEASFSRALRKTSFEALMAGLRAYVAKTDDRPWCNPATWLNQGRWDDAPAIPMPQARGSPPQRTPSQADVFAMIGKRLENGQAEEDSYGARAPVSYLPAARSG